MYIGQAVGVATVININNPRNCGIVKWIGKISVKNYKNCQEISRIDSDYFSINEKQILNGSISQSIRKYWNKMLT